MHIGFLLLTDVFIYKENSLKCLSIILEGMDNENKILCTSICYLKGARWHVVFHDCFCQLKLLPHGLF